jgi:hypothetical protein
VIRSIFWKEWRRSRIILLIFLITSIIIPLFPSVIFKNEGNTGRYFLYFIWILFGFIIGARYEQKPSGPISFLRARPVNEPVLFLVHTSCLLSFTVIVMILSFSAHLLQMALQYPHFPVMGLLTEPGVLFAVVTSLSAFAFTAFPANIGFIRVLAGFLSLAVILFVTEKVFGVEFTLPLLSPDEAPVLYLTISSAIFIVFLTFIFLKASYREIRNAKNRRWMRVAAAASLVAALFVFRTGALFARAARVAHPETISEVIATHGSPAPLIVTMSDGKESRPYIFYNTGSLTGGKFKNTQPNPIHLSGRPITGRLFRPLKWRLVYFSRKPLWGSEIRMTRRDLPIDHVSRMSSLTGYSAGPPFCSPDGDRFAYLSTRISPRAGQNRQQLWIGKFNYYLLSDHVDLSKAADISFEPLGWTPDGYDFMLRRKTTAGDEIWAVDWNAQDLRPFLPEFGSAVITEDDLAQAGEWISLLMQEQGEYVVWLVNYRSGEKVQVGTYVDIPLRTWSDSGEWFSLWNREKGLTIYHVTDKVLEYAEFPDVAALEQMKWSPNGSLLAFVTPNSLSEKHSLRLLNRINRTSSILVEDFPSTEKLWDWLSPAAIVYSDGKELWQVDISGEKMFLTSTELLEKK